MPQLAGALLIFMLRICDVSIGTVRVLYMVRGKRLISGGLGLLESGIFIFAISRVFTQLDNPLNMIGYACGFATGTMLGMTLEKWIGAGMIVARIISRDKSQEILKTLRDEHFGVTVLRGEGQRGEVLVLFIIARRRRSDLLLELIDKIDPHAFVTIESISTAMGGYVGNIPTPASVRK
jgi:uncharacterized protein YebE (UPF0316 family)